MLHALQEITHRHHLPGTAARCADTTRIELRRDRPHRDSTTGQRTTIINDAAAATLEVIF